MSRKLDAFKDYAKHYLNRKDRRTSNSTLHPSGRPRVLASASAAAFSAGVMTHPRPVLMVTIFVASRCGFYPQVREGFWIFSYCLVNNKLVRGRVWYLFCDSENEFREAFFAEYGTKILIGRWPSTESLFSIWKIPNWVVIRRFKMFGGLPSDTYLFSSQKRLLFTRAPGWTDNTLLIFIGKYFIILIITIVYQKFTEMLKCVLTLSWETLSPDCLFSRVTFWSKRHNHHLEQNFSCCITILLLWSDFGLTTWYYYFKNDWN